MKHWSAQPALARLRGLARCGKSAAIWGTAAETPTRSGRQPMTHSRHRRPVLAMWRCGIANTPEFKDEGNATVLYVFAL